MTRVNLLSFALLFGATLHAQSAAPLVADGKQVFTPIKNNLVKLAEKMPADLYEFKPAPEMRSFGALMAHIADAQTRNCSAASGETKAATAASKTSKDDLVAALKESMATCDSAWASLTEANALIMTKFRNGERSKLGIMMYNNVHSNEEYGYASVYLRVKGIVPPSSEGK